MNILFDIGHPAHVHLFKYFIFHLKKQGHTVIVVSREKDIVNALLDYYQIEHIPLSKASKGMFRMFRELVIRDIGIFNLHKKYKFDIAFGTSVSIGHLSFISKVRSYNFNEDDDDVVPLYVWLSYPFVNKIINPKCLRYSLFKNKRILHNSFHKLAYLHPNRFRPSLKNVKQYGLMPGKYIVVRFSALKAHHDVGATGIGHGIWMRIQMLLKKYPLVISRENDPSFQIHPAHMHDVLACAKMLISDSQSMSVEAAVLGIPSVRYNTFVGKSSVLDELEKIYGLTYGFSPGHEEQLFNAIRGMLTDKNILNKWKKKRDRLLHDKTDFSKWMIDFFTQIEVGVK